MFVKTLLRMCKVNYEVKETLNAEDMSPSSTIGKVPFIKCGTILVSDVETITRFFQGKSPSRHLDVSSLNDMKVYTSLLTKLFNAELYLCWMDERIFTTYTKVRSGFKRPFPLDWVLTSRKYKQVSKYLDRFHLTTGEAVFQVDKCCKTLSTRLGDEKYFFRDQATELDALVFAHVHTILSSTPTFSKIADVVKTYPNLVDHSLRIHEEFFSGANTNTTSLKVVTKLI
ncbi:metaxin-2-like isoform X1 [Macrosteles quadrilineatus]|uniref:metaxin-2-like isoform X1 n=1 Tax=Macrosteles quadrilineatus TaxID=74068 RepID=UPI0023E208E8|nr:metaxin-2-like isoform X1 [Macrosteles quadrilineatus]